MAQHFSGDFDALPLLSHIAYGAIPRSASMVDFDNAMSEVLIADPFTIQGAVAIWRGEAIRWRRGNPDIAVDLVAIAARCAVYLREAQDEVLNPGARWERIREAHREARRDLGMIGGRP